MNPASIKLEMDDMANETWTHAEQWQQLIQRGSVAFKQIGTIYTRIFAAENHLDDLHRPSDLRTMQRRIRLMYARLEIPFQIIRNILKSLAEIRDNTVRMYSRMGLWMLDEDLVKHKIKPTLKASLLLETLEFLRKRYDAEWEVKEMVVINLEQIENPNDLEILMEAWSDCRHTGGTLFLRKMGVFYDAVGRRRAL
ncbi:hypothetical protein KR067_003776, partial [Drosophila pandora]